MELKLDKRNNSDCHARLLIVPYGIETLQATKRNMVLRTFNRTLWN